MNPLPVVLSDMRRGRAGIAAVVAVIAVAVALGVVVTAQERALRQGSARAADSFDLVVGARGSPTQLILSAVYLQHHYVTDVVLGVAYAVVALAAVSAWERRRAPVAG